MKRPAELAVSWVRCLISSFTHALSFFPSGKRHLPSSSRSGHPYGYWIEIHHRRGLRSALRRPLSEQGPSVPVCMAGSQNTTSSSPTIVTYCVKAVYWLRNTMGSGRSFSSRDPAKSWETFTTGISSSRTFGFHTKMSSLDIMHYILFNYISCKF